MRRNAYRQKEIRDTLLQRFRTDRCLLVNHLRAYRFRAKAFARRLIHALRQHHEIKRLDHIIVDAQIDRSGNKVIPSQRRQRDYAGLLCQLHGLQPFQNAITIHLRHDEIANQDIRFKFRYQSECFHTVARRADNLDAVLRLQIFDNHISQLYIVICHNHANRVHIRDLPPLISYPSFCLNP